MEPQHQLELLQYILKLKPTLPSTQNMVESYNKQAFSDVVFISLDIGKHQGVDYNFRQSPNYEIGLSILDARDIPSASSQISTDFNPITNRHFVITCLPRMVKEPLHHIFGQPTFYRDACDLFDDVRHLFDTQRNVILVVQNLETVFLLESQEFNMPKHYCVATLDLSAIASCYFPNINAQSSVKEVLKTMGHTIAFPGPSIVGNDSHFIMKALLKLAIRDFRCADKSIEIEESPQSKNIVEIIASGCIDLAANKSELETLEQGKKDAKRRREFPSRRNKKPAKRVTAGAHCKKTQSRQERRNKMKRICSMGNAKVSLEKKEAKSQMKLWSVEAKAFNAEEEAKSGCGLEGLMGNMLLCPETEKDEMAID